ncbi:MAG: DNA alkylation repair protein [Pirellulales bacterium]
MNISDVVRLLEAAGSEQTRKTYRRHGVTAPLYGVRYADLHKLVKQVGVDRELSESLWATGNHDCRVMATMVADAGLIKASTLDAWARQIDNHVLIDSFANLAARSRNGRRRAERWMSAKREWLAATGWHTLAVLAGDTFDVFSADELAKYIDRIEAELHTSPNRVRHEMNQALICIGVRTPALEKRALAAAKRLGKVEVDHGQTSCQTRDAADYIKKTLAYRRKTKTKGRKRTGC